MVTLTGFVGTPVVALNPPAAVLIVSRSVREIMTSEIPAGWPAVLIKMGSAPGWLKLLTITPIAPALKAFVTISVKVVPPRSIRQILPLIFAALVNAAVALLGTP